MANRRIEFDIIANDRASNVFAKVRTAGSNMASPLMTALGGTGNVIGGIDSALRSYNATMYRFNRITYSAVRMAGGAIADFTKDAINNYTELERQHAKTMGAMATEYGKTAEAQAKFFSDSEKLKQQAMQLGTYGPNGKGSLYTVTDVSYAQTSLIKSGMSADDILRSDALSSVLKFAGGNDLDIDTATRFAVNLATVFDIPVERWGTMLDMVTKAADISVIDVEDIMDSLTYTGGIASGLGRNLQEVLGVISIMGQAGLRGRVAGTGMQAFFTRILASGELSDTSIESAPSDYAAQMYNAFIEEAVDPNGRFKDMDEVADLLDTAMSTLNDQEQAWFAKKLFGLYQMKAAYAITGAVDEDGNLITDYINQIENQSKGTNDIKYELMQGSQYGKMQSLKNAWEGTKLDFGEKLSPVVSAISDELFNFLSNNGNYDINWDRLREAINESGTLIGEKYGESIGQAVEDLGNFGIDAALITEAVSPEIGGLFGGIVKLLNGDISGALDEFSEGIEDTNDNIDGLPEDLQDTAKAARNVIIAFTALSGINLATQILQIFTSFARLLILKPIKFIRSLIKSASTHVSTTQSVINSTSTTVNSTNTTINVAKAATVNIAKVPLMNVTASVVNVFGGNGLNGGNSGGNVTGGTPTLPGGGGTIPPILPGGGTPVLPGGGTPVLPGGGTLALPGAEGTVTEIIGAGAATAGAATAGKTITMYNVGGKMMSASQIISTIATKAGIIGAAGVASYFLSSPGLFATEEDRANSGSGNIDFLVAQLKDTDTFEQYINDYNNDKDYATDYYTNGQIYGSPLDTYVYYWARNQQGYTKDENNKDNTYELWENEVKGRLSAREEMMSFYKTIPGIEYLDELMKNNDITEDFLTNMLSWEKDGYIYIGSQEDLNELLDYMYANHPSNTDYGNFSGRFADDAVSKFISNNPNLLYREQKDSNINPWYSGNIASSVVQNILGINGNKPYDNNSSSSIIQNMIKPISDAADRLKSPNINVYVTTNVDKNGNASTKVNINTITRDVARRSSQYGSVAMEK